MSVIVPLFAVSKDACNDKAVTSGNQTYACVTFWLGMTLFGPEVKTSTHDLFYKSSKTNSSVIMAPYLVVIVI
jgi:hypothetical protein